MSLGPSDLVAMAAMVGALAATLAQEAAMGVARALGYEDDVARCSPGRSLASPALGLAACCAAAYANAWEPRRATAAVLACLLAYYVAETDRRERWLPDHGTIALLLAGLLASPFCDAQSKVYGLCANVAILGGFQAACSLLRHRRLEPDAFSGGDVVLAAAIGSWLGLGAGQSALLVAGFLTTAAGIPCLPARPRRTRYEAAVNYDPEGRTLPVGPYLALGMAACMCVG